MKRKSTLLLTILMMLAVCSLANKILVKGFLKTASGPVIHHLVNISTDSLSCRVNHYVYTDSLGYYSDTVTCTTDVRNVKVSTQDCSGVLLSVTKVPTPNNYVEANFTICSTPPPPTNCKADYYFSVDSAHKKVGFSSANSTAPLGDSIVKRTWDFGDGKTEENASGLIHEYAQPGVYQVCFSIKTLKGCESHICKQIKIPKPADNGRKDTLIVKGHVKDADGKSLANQPIYISTDTSGCSLRHSRTTDSLGNYTDTLICTSMIRSVTAQTKNCDGKYLLFTKGRSTATNVIEINFEICKVQPAVHCDAVFKSTHLNRTLLSFDSYGSSTSAGDSIVRRNWSFGNAIYDTTNRSVLTHGYDKAGSYTVCLQIRTARGCQSSYCTTVKVEDSVAPRIDTVIVKGHVRNSYGTVKNHLVYISTDSSACLLKHQRTTDTSGFYADTLICSSWIRSVKVQTENCDGKFLVAEKSRSTISHVIEIDFSLCVPAPPVACHSDFKITVDSLSNRITFNGHVASPAPGDSIVSRRWEFGDGKIEVNAVEISHDYPNAGIYVVCLTIKTAKGCESKECKQVRIEKPDIRCIAQFTTEKQGGDNLTFDSHLSFTSPGDTINLRRWYFGDGSQIATGNLVKVSKEYSRTGIYTACLSIKTLKGCEARFCLPVSVQDTVRNDGDDKFRIVSLYPSPAVSQLTVVVWSAGENVPAEFGVFDVYGNKKSSSTRLLQKGDNVVVIPVSALIAGPYILRVTTPLGIKSRQFYKF